MMSVDPALTPMAQTIVRERNQERRIDARRPVLNTMIVIALLVMAAGIVWLWAHNDGRNEATAAAGQQNARDIAAIQKDLKTVCRKVPDPELGPQEKDACFRAEQSLPPTPAPELLGIRSTAIVSGDLVVTYTDGRTEDKGRVVGEQGKDGSTPAGIVSSTIAGGNLVLQYSDGRTEVVGAVAGPVGEVGADGAPGCSVTGLGTRRTDTSLILTATYSGAAACKTNAGKTVDVGEIPPGPPGKAGDNGKDAPTPTGNAVFQKNPAGDCMYVVAYSNGLNVAAPAPDEFCESPVLPLPTP